MDTIIRINSNPTMFKYVPIKGKKEIIIGVNKQCIQQDSEANDNSFSFEDRVITFLP